MFELRDSDGRLIRPPSVSLWLWPVPTLVAIVALRGCSAFFSSSETALFVDRLEPGLAVVVTTAVASTAILVAGEIIP